MQHDLTSLYTFLCVAEEKSLTRASKRAHLAVSAISKRISELEERTGTSLFNRQPRGMDLTPAGQVMLTHARKIFDTLHQLDTDMVGFSTGVKGRISVFASISALSQFLPDDIKTFAEIYPGIKFDIEERVGTAIIRAIQDGRADIGIFASHTPALDVEYLSYRSDQLGLAVPANHPLAERDAVHFSEALDYEFVGSHLESALCALLDAESEKLERRVDVRVRVSSFDCMCHLVAGQQGISVLPEYVTLNFSKSLPIKLVRLRDEWACRELRIGFKSYKHLSPTVKAFVDHIRRERD